MGGDVSGMKQRILTCRARIAALDVSNKKVKEVGDVLHKCLSTRSEGQATNDKQDTRYFQMENLAMVSVNATASGFLVDADTVGVTLEISMIVGPQ